MFVTYFVSDRFGYFSNPIPYMAIKYQIIRILSFLN